jgi:hypothetical protein
VFAQAERSIDEETGKSHAGVSGNFMWFIQTCSRAEAGEDPEWP